MKTGIETQPYTRWTPDRDALLKRLYPEFGATEAARRLGATRQAVRSRVQFLGVKGRKDRPRYWAPERDALLKRVYLADGPAAAAAALGVSRSAIKNRVQQLGLRRPQRLWTPEEDQVVRDEYAALGALAVAEKLGQTVAAVRRRANILGVKSERWDDAAVERVRTAYAAVGARALAAELLGDASTLSVYRIYRLAERLGVTVPVRHPPAVYDRVRELHGRGLNDSQIAREMADYFPGRHDRERVTAIRRRMKLPAIKQTPEQMRELGRRTRAAQTAAGVNPREQAFARLATSYGLPADLPPRAVEVVLALTSGPKTLDELEAAGCFPRLTWNALPSSYIGGLGRRGLVSFTRVRGGNRRVYFLTASALDMLAKGGANAGS